MHVSGRVYLYLFQVDCNGWWSWNMKQTPQMERKGFITVPRRRQNRAPSNAKPWPWSGLATIEYATNYCLQEPKWWLPKRLRIWDSINARNKHLICHADATPIHASKVQQGISFRNKKPDLDDRGAFLRPLRQLINERLNRRTILWS